MKFTIASVFLISTALAAPFVEDNTFVESNSLDARDNHIVKRPVIDWDKPANPLVTRDEFDDYPDTDIEWEENDGLVARQEAAAPATPAEAAEDLLPEGSDKEINEILEKDPELAGILADDAQITALVNDKAKYDEFMARKPEFAKLLEKYYGPAP